MNAPITLLTRSQDATAYAAQASALRLSLAKVALQLPADEIDGRLLDATARAAYRASELERYAVMLEQEAKGHE